MMSQPLSRAFFYMRPLVTPPVFNRFSGVFFRPLDRLFRDVADFAKDASHLASRINDIEFFLDPLRDPSACPNRVGVAELGRVLFEQAFELGELLIVEFRRSTGNRFWIKGIDALFGDDFSPKFDRRKATTENFNDFLIAKSLFDQLAALNPAVLCIRKFVLRRTP